MKELGKIAQNSIFGFIIGDILGLPVEFSKREDLKINQVVDLLESNLYYKTKGTWSDDTSMILCTMDSIANKKVLDYEDLMNKFILWFRNGEYTPFGYCIDIGDTTRQALEKYIRLKCNPIECGGESEFDNGNGSLMRILPIAFYCFVNKLNDKQIYEVVEKVSSLTHRNIKSIFSCYLYVIFMIEILKEIDKDKKQIYLNFKNYIKDKNYSYDGVFNRLLKEDITQLHEKDIKSSGYVIDTIESAIWCFLTTNSYRQAVLKAVNLGGDTDTIGAITGGIAGAYYYKENLLKDNWSKQLIDLERILEIENKFLSFLMD